MRTLIVVILLSTCAACHGQSGKKVSLFLGGHIDLTMYDRTRSNNAVGFGGDLQFVLHTKIGIEPLIDATSDVFGGTKEFYYINNKPAFAKDVVSTVMAGGIFKLSKNIYAGLLMGPAFYNDRAWMAFKPVAGILFPANHRLGFRIGFTHVVQHDDVSHQPFGYFHFGLSLRLL